MHSTLNTQGGSSSDPVSAFLSHKECKDLPKIAHFRNSLVQNGILTKIHALLNPQDTINYSGGRVGLWNTGEVVEFGGGGLHINTSTSVKFLLEQIKIQPRVIIHESTEPMRDSTTLKQIKNMGVTIRFLADSWRSTGYYVLEATPYFRGQLEKMSK